MSSQTVVATANILRDLSHGDARAALAGVLDAGPDLVGLQEWNVLRLRLLRETGSVAVVPGGHPRVGRRCGYLWTAPLIGGTPVGARADRFELVESHARHLSRLGRADRPDRTLGLELPRLATFAVYRDTVVDRTVCLVNYHLVPTVQARGKYQTDRPKLVARHQGEVAGVQRIVDEQLELGRVVYAVGDSNFHGLRLRGLTSAWEGREESPGTHGGKRKIDDVHGPGPATSVVLLDNASDHMAVITRRDDRAE